MNDEERKRRALMRKMRRILRPVCPLQYGRGRYWHTCDTGDTAYNEARDALTRAFGAPARRGEYIEWVVDGWAITMWHAYVPRTPRMYNVVEFHPSRAWWDAALADMASARAAYEAEADDGR